MSTLPEIKNVNGVPVFYVDGKPFIGLGGELHNSSASSTRWMREKVWPALRPLHMNSVIATVSWEQIEPQQGVFDFSAVDDLIHDAHQEGLKLILIWFGLWKNGASTYVPEWVKLDRETYRICEPMTGTKVAAPFGGAASVNTISPLCEAAVDADAKAFKELMKHIKAIDEYQTVILMQVENEIGYLGSSRDYSDFAEKAFKAPVPDAVAEAFGVSGSWEEAFKEEADEAFMAWYYGRAVEKIASSGQAAYGLPMYVNAWLQQHPDRPGSYPSGGPIMKMIKMWKLAAPTLCMFAPDIYVPDFEKVIAEYSTDGNPLFIPETAKNVRSAASVFLAVCEYNAIGFNPFGIEDICGDTGKMDAAILASLNIDVSAFSDEGSDVYLPAAYDVLNQMMPLIIEARGTGRLRGFYHFGPDNGRVLSFSRYDTLISYGRALPGMPPAGGAVLEVSPDEFYVFGTNFSADFLPKKGENKRIEYLRIEEGTFENGSFVRGRILNGDEFHIQLGAMPGILHVKVFDY